MRRGSTGLLPSITCWELNCLTPLALFPLSADRHSGALGTADTLCSKVSQSNSPLLPRKFCPTQGITYPGSKALGGFTETDPLPGRVRG